MQHFRITPMLYYGALVVCSGCASVLSHTQSDEALGPYSGMRVDGHLVANPNSIEKPPVHPAVVTPLSLIDLPLSAALDTLLLPIDLTYRRPKAPAAIELELEEINVKDAVKSKTPDGPSTLPVRLKIRNPRPQAVRLRSASLAQIIGSSDYVDIDGQLWKIPWGGFQAIYDRRAVVSLPAHSESEIELVLLTGKDLLRPVSHSIETAEEMQAFTSLDFKVRDSHVETYTGASIPVKGNGTVSVKR